MASPPPIPSPKNSKTPRVVTANTALRRRVVESALLGEWDAVREAVEVQGCSVSVQDQESGCTLAHCAAYQCDEAQLRWLAEHGAPLRVLDGRGNTPLSVAELRKEGGAVVNFLLEQAYSPVERVLYGRAALSEALLQEGLGDATAAALDEPLRQENNATLALAIAARHGTAGLDAVPLLRWMRARGADLEAVDDDGNALLHMVDFSCGAESSTALVAWALQEAQVQHKDLRNSHDGDTPALLCAYASPSGNDALRCLELLEAAGANLSLANANGMNTAMVLARYQGDGPWLEWCFSKAGVEPSSQCAKGRTAAQYLALHGVEEGNEEEA